MSARRPNHNGRVAREGSAKIYTGIYEVGVPGCSLHAYDALIEPSAYHIVPHSLF